METSKFVKAKFKELKNEIDENKAKSIIITIFNQLNKKDFNDKDFEDFNKVDFLKIIESHLNEKLAIEIIKSDGFKLEQEFFFEDIYKMIIKNTLLSENVIKSLSINGKKNKNKKSERQFKIVKLLSESDINSLNKIDIKRKIMLYFEKEIANADEVKIDEKDFNTISTKFSPPIIKYKDMIEFCYFITELTNDSIKKEVLERELSIVDLMTNYNLAGQNQNQINKMNKNLTLFISSCILGINKNNDLNLENIFIDNNFFNEFVNNITYFQKNNKHFLALKESILLLESYLRLKIENDSKLISFAKSMNNEKIKKAHYDVFIFTSKNKSFKNRIDRQKARELTDELIKEKSQNFNIKSLSLKDLLDVLTNGNIMRKEENEFLNYILLKNNNEGLDLRNEIFHGLLTEEDLEIKFGTQSDFYLFFITIYIVFTIMNLILKSEGKKHVFSINKHKDKDCYDVKMHWTHI